MTKSPDQPPADSQPSHTPTQQANISSNIFDTDGLNLIDKFLPVKSTPQQPLMAKDSAESIDAGLVVPGYTVTRLIAQGGMGKVWHGYELTLNREVAMKTLKPGANADRFITEAKITAMLPHPNIPPVYAIGQLDNGTPWLAMKFVRGHTLNTLLQTTPRSPASLSQMVQIFEQVAQAVGFAHSHGLIHRDIKPPNIMVGEFGEVLLMDWGLAKNILHSTDPTEPDTINDSACCVNSIAESAGLTEEGHVLGTPGYMAPEQARGERLDARTDVFALGSLLATILTGQPAFVGITATDILIRTAHADLADVKRRLDLCGADSELIAVAKRCLSAIPEGRPADGREVAAMVATYRANVEARLRHAETRAAEALVLAAEASKRRRLRIWASSAVMLSLGLGLVVSLTFLQRAITAENQAITEAQRALESETTAIAERDAKDLAFQDRTKALESEQQARSAERIARDKTRTALRALTDMLVENQLSREGFLTDDSKAFLRMMIEQYQQLARLSGDDAESRSIQGEGLFRVGRMQHHLGEFVAAEQTYRKAIELYQKLVDDFSDQIDNQLDLASCHHNFGLLLFEQGRYASAEQSQRAALTIRKRLNENSPEQAQLLSDLSISYNNLSVLLRQTGRLDEADATRDASLAIQKRLVEKYPANFEYRFRLAMMYNNMGNQLNETHQFIEAEQALLSGIKLFKSLNVKVHSQGAAARNEMGVCYNNLSIVQRELGKFADSELASRKSIDILTQLASEYPTMPSYRYYLCGSYLNLGVTQSRLCQHLEAEKNYRHALSLQKQLVAQFPSRVNFRSQLADCHNNLSALCHHLGRLNESEQALNECLVIRRQLATEYPTRTSYQADLAKGLHNYAILMNRLGKLDDAEEFARQAVAIIRQLVQKHPEEPQHRLTLADYLDNLGLLSIDKRQHRQADQLFREGLTIRESFKNSKLTGPTLRFDLSISYQHLGRVFAETTRLAEAEEYWQKAVEIREQLVSEHPKHEEFRVALANQLVTLSFLQRDNQDDTAAEKSLRRSLSHRNQLIADYPHEVLHRIYQGGTYCNLGNLYRDNARVTEGLAAYEQAVSILAAVVKTNPEHPTARLFLRNSYWGRATINQHLKRFPAALADWDSAAELSMPSHKRTIQLGRAECLVLAGETGKAVAAVNSLVKQAGWTPVDRYKLGCIVAMAANQDAVKRDEYAARAVELLHRAIEAGYRNKAAYVNNPILNVLQQRQDFQSLLSQLGVVNK